MDNNWFKEMFIDEAKAALNSRSPLNEEQVNSAVTTYLEENPIESATAVGEDGVLKVT